jgi:hypothetical protein
LRRTTEARPLLEADEADLRELARDVLRLPVVGGIVKDEHLDRTVLARRRRESRPQLGAAVARDDRDRCVDHTALSYPRVPP